MQLLFCKWQHVRRACAWSVYVCEREESVLMHGHVYLRVHRSLCVCSCVCTPGVGSVLSPKKVYMICSSLTRFMVFCCVCVPVHACTCVHVCMCMCVC